MCYFSLRLVLFRQMGGAKSRSPEEERHVMKAHLRPFSLRLFIAGFVLLMPILPRLVLSAPAQQISSVPTRAALVGIWKECYDARLRNLYEIDTGFLTLSPDGTFWRWSGDNQSETILTGTWDVRGRQVHFLPTKRYALVRGAPEHLNDPGPLDEWTLMYRPAESVSLFDNLRKPAIYPVLAWKDGGTNYGFAKIYGF